MPMSTYTSLFTKRAHNGSPAEERTGQVNGLILAAGSGTRMQGLEGAKPKCLLEVGGRPLIEHQVTALRNAGVDSIVVVVGYQAERIRRTVGPDASYILNPAFASTNSLQSFVLGAEHLAGDTLVLNADVLFPEELISMMANRKSSAFAYDSSAGDDDEAMKVNVHRRRLLSMSKQMPARHNHGENLGVIRFDRQALRYAVNVGWDLISKGRQRDWLATAVNATARWFPFEAVDVKGMPWIEIDFPEDLEKARTEVWPAICSSPQRQPSRPLLPAALDPLGSALQEAI